MRGTPVLLLAILAAAATPSASPLHVFQDWIVGCDNARRCRAVGLIPKDGGDDAGVVEVTRAGDPSAAPEVELFDVPRGTVTLAVGPARLAAAPDANSEVVVPPSSRRAFLQAVRGASELRYLDASGAPVGRASLAGAVAALLFVDNAQHRIGTATAMVRVGPAPASAVPSVPPLPFVHAAPGSPKPPARFGAAVAAQLLGRVACKPDAGRRDDPPSFSRLDATHTLALVPTVCVSGEYNIYSDAYILTDGARTPAPAAFGRFPGEGREGDDTSSANVEWDAKERVLRTGMLGRGMRDCGVWHDYIWTGRGFAPGERREMGECRGGMEPITTWRARVIR